MTAESLHALAGYPWPGNVRELCNVVERMVVLKGKGMLDMSDVPPQIRAPRGAAGGLGGPGGLSVELPSSGIDLGEALQRVEGVLIEQALERTRGNRTQAAALLRINRTTLVEKLKRREGGGEDGEPE
jgi:DNA-binding NtrC family response regulator